MEVKEGTPGRAHETQNLEAETAAESMKEHCLVARSPLFSQPASSYTSDQLLIYDTAHRGLGTHTSTVKQKHVL